jgi:hypothetical protein
LGRNEVEWKREEKEQEKERRVKWKKKKRTEGTAGANTVVPRLLFFLFFPTQTSVIKNGMRLADGQDSIKRLIIMRLIK